MSIRIKDTVWIQQSFILPQSALDEVDKRRRILTNAAYKFTDTTLGGNFAINAPPQFTRYADIRVGGSQEYSHGATNGSTTKGGVKWAFSTGRFMAEGDNPRRKFTTPSAGMGRYYSEAIDDWGQDLVMRFGVPEYNSLTQFFGNFYSTDAAMISQTGRTRGVFATLGRAAGFLLSLPLQPIILGGQLVRFLANWPSSKYYYMKPTMYPYWQAVNTLVNGIAVNMGVIPMALTEAQRSSMNLDSNFLANQQEMLKEYAQVLPDIFLNTSDANGPTPGGLDVYKIANRAQRIANTFNAEVIQKLDSGSLSDPSARGVASALFTAMNELRQDLFMGGGLKRVPSQGIDEYRRIYLESGRNSPDDQKNYINLDGTTTPPGGDDSSTPSAPGIDSNGNPTGTSTANPALSSDNIDSSSLNQVEVESAGPGGNRDWYNTGGVKDAGPDTPNGYQPSSWLGSLGPMFEAERRDGAQFVTFRVGYSGTTSESFASSVEESQISQKFNSTSSSARSARFDWANGADLKSIPGVGAVVGAVKDFVAGTLEGVHMSGLLALAGNAFVDIPKTWNGSSANLPSASYTIKLRSPYGTKMSRLMNLYVPLGMLLAAALPLSTGKRSYTSPFICEAFCRGRHAIRLGMITDMSITRGSGNLGWNQDGDALGIDVSFTITDMSTIMHMPIQVNFGLSDKILQGAGDLLGNAFGQGSMAGQQVATYLQKGTYDDDNAFTDYLAVLGGLSWQDMIYANRRWRLARYRQMQAWTSWKSPARVSAWAGDTTLGRLINAISVETDRTD